MIKTTGKLFLALISSIVLLLLGGGGTPVFSATNAGVAPILELSQISINLEHNISGSRNIVVTSNGTWSNPVVSANATNWLRINNTHPLNRNGNGSFNIGFSSNQGVQRSGTITVTQGSITRRITVIQRGQELTLSQTSLNLQHNISGTRNIAVTSNGTWSNPSVNADAANWLSVENVNPTNRRGDGRFTVRFQSNPNAVQRSGTVTVTQWNVTRRITVTQQAAPATLTLLNVSWSPASGGATRVFTVNTNTTWSMPSSSATWLSVSDAAPANRTGSGSFRLTATANTTRAERTAIVTVSGGGITRRLTVIQQPQAPTLTLSSGAWNPGSGAGNTTINVTSNTTWSVPSSNVNWLTISNVTPSNRAGNGSFRINATANLGAQRTGVITVTVGGITRTVTVTQQAAPTLTLSSTTSTLIAEASNAIINVRSNTTWSIPTSNTTWLTVSHVTPANRTGNGSFRINTTANTGAQRTGVITVTSGGITRTVTVTQQAGSTLSVSQTTLNLPRGSGSSTIHVTSNGRWSAVSNQSWLTLEDATGTGNGSFRARRAQNHSEIPRLAVITVSQPGVPDVRISVTQEAEVLMLSISSWMAPQNGGFASVAVTANGTWSTPTVSAGAAGWLIIDRITPTNRNGDGSFRINAVQNLGAQQRTGTITVRLGGAERQIRVTQGAAVPTLNLLTTATTLNGGANHVTIDVVSNATWSMPSSNVTWLTISHITPANRTGNGSFRINATANPGGQRTGIVTVTAGGIRREVKVTQLVNSHTFTMWHSDSNRVGFWPGAINTSIRVHGVNVGRNMYSFLDDVNRIWGDALGVRINRTPQTNANIQNHVGRRAPLAAYMRTYGGQIATYAPIIFPGNILGVAFTAPPASSYNIQAGGATRIVDRYTGVARTFSSYEWSNSTALSDIALRNILLHEVGHALGWRGHSRIRGEIMYANVLPTNHNNLSANERRHLRQIYDAFR